MLAAFGFQLFTSSLWEYALGAAVASLFAYLLLFSILQNNRLLMKEKPAKPQEDLQDVLIKLQRAFDDQKVYRQSTLNLNQLGELINVPVYKISRALSQHFGKTFPEYTNHYRVSEVRDRLTDPNHKHYTIEALAYDAGFNTPSSFYTAFKKEFGMTPKQYQKATTLKKTG